MDYNSVIEKTGEAIDAAGVAVIVAGGLIAFGHVEVVQCGGQFSRDDVEDFG